MAYIVEHRIPGIPWAAFARSRSLETALTFMRALAATTATRASPWTATETRSRR